jgi:hypothetical protein
MAQTDWFSEDAGLPDAKYPKRPDNRRNDARVAVGKYAKKLAKFAALALLAAGAIKMGMAIHDAPPDESAWVMGQGQARTQAGLESLGRKTSFFGVGEEGVVLTVSAPKGAVFVFAGGGQGPEARVVVPRNARAPMKFDYKFEGDSETRSRVVDFRGWQARAPMDFWSAGETPAPAFNARWMEHEVRGTKSSVHHYLDGVEYWYAMAPGQKSVELELPWLPVEPRYASETFAVRENLDAAKASPGFEAYVVAPPSMKFHYGHGAPDVKRHPLSNPSASRQAWSFELIDQAGNIHPVVVDVRVAGGQGSPEAARQALPKP